MDAGNAVDECNPRIANLVVGSLRTLCWEGSVLRLPVAPSRKGDSCYSVGRVLHVDSFGVEPVHLAEEDDTMTKEDDGSRHDCCCSTDFVDNRSHLLEKPSAWNLSPFHNIVMGSSWSIAQYHAVRSFHLLPLEEVVVGCCIPVDNMAHHIVPLDDFVPQSQDFVV